MSSLRASGLAIGLFFFGDGLMIGSWAGRIPAVQHHAGLSTSRLGLALFAASLGALVAMPVAGRLCERAGSRSITLVGLLLGGGSLFAASLSASLVGLSVALFGFGAGFGTINVAVNAQGVALESLSGRRILSSFHALFSAGGLVGAGTAAVVAAAGLGVQLHYGALALVLTAFAVAGVGYLLPPEADDRPEARMKRGRFARPPRAILVLGAAAFCTMLAEGAAVDWSAVYLSRSFGAAAGVAALAYTAFAFMMMTSRAVGDRLNRRLGAVTLARSGAAVATIGLSLALVIGSVPVAMIGFAAMGAGLGVVIPVLFRAAASTDAVSASVGLATVSTIGWFGFLAGPPAIGFAASAVGLRGALGIVVLATLTLVVLAGYAHPGRRKDGVPAAGYRTSP
jgi:Na+/melibiose symporter-like transporter